ncbi:MAG: LysR family transcriptional regulator [Rhodospirillales bacterium]
MTRRPNIRHLRAFSLTVCHNNVSRAAQLAHLSQSAVSQAIARLEDHYGCSLLERRNTGVYPTAYGMIAARRIDRATDRLRRAVERLLVNRRNAGRLTVEVDRMISVSQLSAICAVAATGGFKSGADQLGLAQPSVHRAVRDLESLLGIALFERTSRGISPTRTGAAFALEATLVLKEIDNIGDDLDIARGRFEGRIAVGSLALGQSDLLPRAITGVSRRFPRADFFLQDGSFEQLHHALQHGEIDMVIGARRLQPEPGLVQEVLFTDQLSVMARAGHPLAGKADINVADLAAWPWVLPRPATPTRAVCDAIFDGSGYAPSGGVIETGSMLMVRGLLAASDRLTVLSRRQVRVEEAAGLLVPLDFRSPGMARDIALMHRLDWRPTELQEALIQQLRDLAPGSSDD